MNTQFTKLLTEKSKRLFEDDLKRPISLLIQINVAKDSPLEILQKALQKGINDETLSRVEKLWQENKGAFAPPLYIRSALAHLLLLHDLKNWGILFLIWSQLSEE